MKNNMFFILITVMTGLQLNAGSPMPTAHRLAEHCVSEIQNSPCNKEFPILFGASTSEHQCSKQCTPDLCDWSAFAQKHGLLQPTDPGLYPCDWWHHYRTYIPQLKEKLGCNSLRVSLEWALIQKSSHSFDHAVLDHYVDEISCLLENNIHPLVCFHHYTSPCWFANQGGFTEESSKDAFEKYTFTTYEYLCEKLVNHPVVGATVRSYIQSHDGALPFLIISFNSPEGVAFKGHHTMEGPPADPAKKGLGWVAQTLHHMMRAHTAMYHALHNAPVNEKYGIKPQIGLLKNITQIDAAKKTAYQKLCYPITQYLFAPVGEELQNKCVYRYLTQGVWKIKGLIGLALKGSDLDQERDAAWQPPLDWIGLNYYSNQVMALMERIKEPADSPNKTDNDNYRIYPHGLYRAIKEVYKEIAVPVGAQKNGAPIPIYVTETGIATNDPAKQERYYKEYLGAFLKALHKEYSVRGFLVWTAFDNYEWPKKLPTSDSHIVDEKKQDRRTYGLCAVSPDGLTLTPKEGALWYSSFISHAATLVKQNMKSAS